MSKGQSSGWSWLPPSNSVNVSTAENSGSEEIGESDVFGVTEQEVERAAERTREFVEKYPARAQLPLTRSPGRSVLESYVREKYREEYVDPAGEFKDGFTVERLDRVEPVTWADAVFLTLVGRQKYDSGVSGRFRDRADGSEFSVELEDAWTAGYAEEQRAKNAGAQRQLMGGEYPEDSPTRSGEVEPGVWREPVTALLTITGSARPGVELLPPADHADLVDTWTGSLYDRVRNLVEHKWGVPSDRWGYVRSDDPHGIEEPGTNAGYTHAHPVVFFDRAAADGLPAGDGEFVEEVTAEIHGDVIEKHVEECAVAEPEAHRPERSVEVKLELDSPGAYASAYALPEGDTPLLERSVEYLAWAAVERATGRQRIARSQLFTRAAAVDRCKQSEEHEHGGRLTYDGGAVVCANCGEALPGELEAETVVGNRLNEQATEPVVTDGGVEEAESDAERPAGEVIGARVGGPSVEREAVQRYVERHGEPDEVTAAVMGEMGVDPRCRETVERVVAGEPPPVEEVRAGGGGPWSRCEPPESDGEPDGEPGGSRYELTAVESRATGETVDVDGGGGGATMVEVKLPVEKLLQETRLRHFEVVDVEGGKRVWAPPGDVGTVRMWIGDGWVLNEPEKVARWLVEEVGSVPWVAEKVLEFSTYDGEELPEELREPVAEPPGG